MQNLRKVIAAGNRVPLRAPSTADPPAVIGVVENGKVVDGRVSRTVAV